MNRAARWVAEAKQRRNAPPAAPALDRANLVRVTAALVEADPTASGATLIMPYGEVSYIDAATLRRGGAA